MPWSCWFDGHNYWFYVNGVSWLWLDGKWQETKVVYTVQNDR